MLRLRANLIGPQRNQRPMTCPQPRPVPVLPFAAAALALVLALPLAGPAAGQAEDAPAPGAGLPLGEEVGDAEGDTYVADTFDDWTKICQRVEDGSDPCGLAQLITDPEGAPAAQITIFPLPPGGEAVAGANIELPLGTVLSRQISIRVDGGNERRYPFFFCDVGGCYAQIGLTAAMVESFRRGNEAVMTVFFILAPEQPIELPISLMGFTAGYSALPPAN